MTPQPKLLYELVNSEVKNNKTYFTMRLVIDGKTMAEIKDASGGLICGLDMAEERLSESE